MSKYCRRAAADTFDVICVCIRQKAEEERVRKEEEKARRELIKQEYRRRKQQELLEEQGVTKPRPRNRRARPKSLHRAESSCSARKKVYF